MKSLKPRRLAALGRTFLALITESYAKGRRLNIPVIAGSLAFTTVLSIVPLLAVLFYVFKIFGGFAWAYERLMPFLLDNLSEGTGEIVEQQLAAFVQQVHAKEIGWAGIAALLVTSLLAYSNIVKAIDLIWDVGDGSWHQHSAFRAILLLVIGPILLTASIVLSTAVAARMDWVPHGGQLVAFALTVALYSMVYGLVPLGAVPARAVLVGSLLPAALWEGAKYVYASYTRKVVTYSAFYGSWAALPLFLIWIYIAWYITLLGGVWVRTLQLHHERSDAK